MLMPENARLTSCIGQIPVDLCSKKLSIQLHLTEFSLLNNVSFLYKFGDKRA